MIRLRFFDLPRFLYVILLIGAGGAVAADPAFERELIVDNGFRRGFILWEPTPGKHLRYGELKGFAGERSPAWGLSQWSSKLPLDPASAVREGGFLVCSNSAKAITLDGQGGCTLAVNSAVEYGRRARMRADPWVHCLVEQEFDPPARLAELTAARLHIEARLTRSVNLHDGDYAPGLHAAQFQIFFTVQNRNRESKGYGDLVWFGIPIYDNRDRFPKAFKARDFGGTGKYIFTPAGQTFTPTSAHDGGWLTIDKDLLPLMKDALQSAWTSGFLSASRTFADYAIGGMNMGWELPGTFDVEMKVRALSLRVIRVPSTKF